MKWCARPYTRSRARYPATEAERRAATFIVSCRRIGVALPYEEIERLCSEHFAGLGRGCGGKWERHLLARIAERAARTNPTITPKRKSPARSTPKGEKTAAAPVPTRLAVLSRFVAALSAD